MCHDGKDFDHFMIDSVIQTKLVVIAASHHILKLAWLYF